MNDENLKNSIVDSLSDDKVPNDPGKIKALYCDRISEKRRPWYQFKRVYLIGGPILTAAVAVAIVVPITLNASRRNANANRAPEPTAITETTKIVGSNNQIAMAFDVLSNAVRTLDGNILPSESIDTSVSVIKDLHVLNAYMYTFETQIGNGFGVSYSETVDEADDTLRTLSFKDDVSTSASYSYKAKSSFDGEENYSLTGALTVDGTSYPVEGDKGGAFGYYSSDVTMYLDEEKTYGFNVSFDQDLLSDQAICFEEFKDDRTLSKTTVSLMTRYVKESATNYVRASLDGYDFEIYKVNDEKLRIDAYVDGESSDSFTVKITEEDGVSEYEYTSGIGIDLKLRRK